MLQIGAASLLEIGASAVTNWGSYYKLGQPLLQNRAIITNWGITHSTPLAVASGLLQAKRVLGT